jgi:hypothetical protein
MLDYWSQVADLHVINKREREPQPKALNNNKKPISILRPPKRANSLKPNGEISLKADVIVSLLYSFMKDNIVLKAHK